MGAEGASGVWVAGGQRGNLGELAAWEAAVALGARGFGELGMDVRRSKELGVLGLKEQFQPPPPPPPFSPAPAQGPGTRRPG